MTNTDSHPLIKIDNLTRGYPGQKVIFHEFDMTLSRWDFIFVVGKSGTGKTSLMKLITGQITPPKTMVYVEGNDVARLSAGELQAQRRRIGVVYQDYKLLPDRSVYDNIAMPLVLDDLAEEVIQHRVKTTAKEFGFHEKLWHKVSLLSGGEKQKVSIMRALITLPQCILADEPTGNLDREASVMIADMLIEANRRGHSIVLITHDQRLMEYTQSKLPMAKVVEVLNG
jgi:cell division transport system ATP-binding protein